MSSTEKHAHEQSTGAQPVDLWCVRVDEAISPALLAQYRQLLAPQEIEQADRFRSQGDRWRAIVGRVLMRWALSQYRPHIAPDAWQLAATPLGKPYVAQPEAHGLQLNLSHSRDLAVCAVTSDSEVGVDVEAVDRAAQYIKIADRFFHPQESQLLAQTPAEKQAEIFIRLWTLKEALLKACGRGLTGPLDRICFHLPDDRAATVSLHDPSLGESSDWQFAEVRLAHAGAPRGATDYQIAVAVRTRQPLGLSIRQTVPLRWIGDRHEASAGALWRLEFAQLRQGT